MDNGFAAADLILEEAFSTQQVEHAYLEPEAGIAYVDHEDVVTVISPSQNITHHRHMLAGILALPINKVRFIMSPVGGGFGGEEDMIWQGMLAVAAMKTHRPVRLGLDPFEIRRRNMMKERALTHTQQRLTSASIDRVLDAAEQAARWEPGPVGMRGPTRGDLGGPGTRAPCTLGARFETPKDSKERVA
ncbi:molybdopterin cofactor-binding domain-containing protein [Rhodovulum sp.]|uniref:molybdopterin cofactor-binding domain-containing protein n=1 Tax=Rhodovulum sp. TaxID=34009 RepID=UPI00257BE739|nr:molybdopterin cofactor-binding domain-containing protein [Rhodovulum sp.]